MHGVVLVAVAVTGTPVPHDTPAPAFVSVDVLMPPNVLTAEPVPVPVLDVLVLDVLVLDELVLDVAVADDVAVLPVLEAVAVREPLLVDVAAVAVLLAVWLVVLVALLFDVEFDWLAVTVLVRLAVALPVAPPVPLGPGPPPSSVQPVPRTNAKARIAYRFFTDDSS